MTTTITAVEPVHEQQRMEWGGATLHLDVVQTEGEQ